MVVPTETTKLLHLPTAPHETVLYYIILRNIDFTHLNLRSCIQFEILNLGHNESKVFVSEYLLDDNDHLVIREINQ